jgi:hypothetical protein
MEWFLLAVVKALSVLLQEAVQEVLQLLQVLDLQRFLTQAHLLLVLQVLVMQVVVVLTDLGL